MGEYADMILDGEMCQLCGGMLEGKGYPTLCHDCQLEADKEKAERCEKQRTQLRRKK